MANMTEPSSTISYTSSSYLSNGSSAHMVLDTACPPPVAPPTAAEAVNSLEVISLGRLSSNLESLLLDTGFDCTDADIIVEGVPVGVHRCILAARCPFFRGRFAEGSARKEGRPKYKMDELVPDGPVCVEAFKVLLNYLYTGKIKPAPEAVSICADNFCAHDACRPAIEFAVEMMYASCAFQIHELISLLQRRLVNFVDKALVEDVIPIVRVAFHSKHLNLLNHCTQRVARSDLDDISLERELPSEVADEIRSIRKKTQPEKVAAVYEKSIRNIHRALDIDDVELVKMLLKESGVTLDEAYALHYAVAYCDSKVVAELLDMESADVNLRNVRGYTPLHVAAMRREPDIIVKLLTKGALISETTADGRNAVRICRKLTRLKDYKTKTQQGQESNKNQICIDILEREMRRNPAVIEDAVTSPFLADDLHMNLLYLENRVAFARLFFPSEAKVAMKIAHADTTSEFAGLAISPKSNLREVDLNETPAMQTERLHARVKALKRTVELGRRFFPHCSQVLDKLLEDDMPDLVYLLKGTPDEQESKRARFCELKEDVKKAFCEIKEDVKKAYSKDKALSNNSALSPSSSSMQKGGNTKQSKAIRK